MILFRGEIDDHFSPGAQRIAKNLSFNLNPFINTFYFFFSGGSSLKITDNMLCAGVNGTILSGCHGDSGGPFVCQTFAGNWVLQGAVSWGSPRCSAAERYSVFARVAKFRNWIDQNMGLTPTPSIGKCAGSSNSNLKFIFFFFLTPHPLTLFY